MQNYQMLHSEACERNKAPILECLKSTLSEKEVHFLELGFGTGQHAYAFSEAFPEKTFTIADRESYHGPFMARVEALGKRENIQGILLFLDSRILNIRSKFFFLILLINMMI